jgi:glycosyltransferase involved in cell wall biosynthesis
LKPDISLVVATFNRSGPLDTLLRRLEGQTLPKDRWEVIVAVDGSLDNTDQILQKWTSKGSLPLTWFRQENAGQCVARHNAILKTLSDKIIVMDDDLDPCPAFLESHLAMLRQNDPKTVVIGKVVPTRDWEERPLYELVREHRTQRRHQEFEEGRDRPGGEDLVTQNVSFHKAFYLEAGGFDPDMRLGEDTLLGVAFERKGGTFVFGKDAWAIHESAVGSHAKWVSRQYDYGKYIWLSWKKLNEDYRYHPLRDYCTGSRVNRLAVFLFVRSDMLLNWMVSSLKKAGVILRKIGLMHPAIATHKGIISLKQHQGLKDTYGSWSAFRKALREYKDWKASL